MCWARPVGVLVSCLPPRWSPPCGSAGDSSAGCARSRFVADRLNLHPVRVASGQAVRVVEDSPGSTGIRRPGRACGLGLMALDNPGRQRKPSIRAGDTWFLVGIASLAAGRNDGDGYWSPASVERRVSRRSTWSCCPWPARSLILFLLTMEWTEARLVASVRSTRRRKSARLWSRARAWEGVAAVAGVRGQHRWGRNRGGRSLRIRLRRRTPPSRTRRRCVSTRATRPSPARRAPARPRRSAPRGWRWPRSRCRRRRARCRR